MATMGNWSWITMGESVEHNPELSFPRGKGPRVLIQQHMQKLVRILEGRGIHSLAP